VSTGVSERIIKNKVLPQTSDLDKKLNSNVIVKALIDKQGLVRGAEAIQIYFSAVSLRLCSGDSCPMSSTDNQLLWRRQSNLISANAKLTLIKRYFL
jgi:hypothetical protein